MSSDAPNAAAALRERLRLAAERERARRGEAEVVEGPPPAPAPAPVVPVASFVPSPTKIKKKKKREKSTQHVAAVLGHFVAGRFGEAVETWKRDEEWIDLDDDRSVLVRALVAVWSLVPRELVLILARGIVRNALSSTYPPLLAYARTQREQAAVAHGVLLLHAVPLANAIGKALIDTFVERDEVDEPDPIEPDPIEEEPGDGELDDEVPPEHRPRPEGRSAIWWFAGSILAVCAIGGVISLTRPSQRAPAPARVSTMRSADAATPAHEYESRANALREIRRSADLLVQNRWVESRTEVDELAAALARSDCETATDMTARIRVGADAIAREHVDSIRIRMRIICGDPKYLLPRNSE